jgi:hypothetical protein
MDATQRMLTIDHSEGLWRALHDSARVDGPKEILRGEECLARDVSFHLDDYGADLMLGDRFRASRKGGIALVESVGHFPFGAEVRVSQSLRYAANHLRAVVDVGWPAGATVRQRLGLGCVFLPGRWERFFCLPPCAELAAGAVAAWHDLPAGPSVPVTVRQWQHPPLALVFQRPDGSRFEVGTGSDLWRWERCLEAPSASGHYAVVAEPDGVRVLRAPLAPATTFQPRARTYRFCWYMAWQPGAAEPRQPKAAEPVPVRFSAHGEALVREAVGKQGSPRLLLDMAEWPCPPRSRRLPTAAALGTGERAASPCWESSAVQKAFRRTVRQIASLGPEGFLTLRGMAPGLCWDPGHWERRGEPLPHWDIDGLLAVSEWARQQLGPGWQIAVEAAGWEVLPSVAGLFARTGFAAPADEASDA